MGLTDAERQFLDDVADAAFANPFGEHRVAADLRITGLQPTAPQSERVDAVAGAVRDFLERFQREERKEASLPGQDGERVRLAHLFDAFHRNLDEFDTHIREQLRHDAESREVAFGPAALAHLRSVGFTKKEACRYFSMFFQLRRAFYFIKHSLTGRCDSMRQLRRALWDSVFTQNMRLYETHLWNRMEDFSTLLLGETGTGKGAAAAAIGRSGFIPFDESANRFVSSFTSAFLSINLSQFPESLIESELFGHRKGAFTGAMEGHEGVFTRCSPHGAILLDEIGEVSVPVQIKLLHVLQERTFSPVGSHERRRFHGRVIAATNRPLTELRAERMRDDFFYRLSSDIITVPTLRQRIREAPGELTDLVALLLERTVGARSATDAGQVADAIRRHVGAEYAWPGNVRELEQCVRSVLLKDSCISATCPSQESAPGSLAARIEAGTCTASELLAEYCRLLYARFETYGEVARRTGLDRRTAKKYVHLAETDSAIG